MSIRNLIKRSGDEPASSNSMLSFQNEMNRLFDGFFTGGLPSLNHIDTRAFSPTVEVSETGKYVELSAELPGLSEEDIEITLSKDHDAIVMRGEKKFEEEKKDKNFYRAERQYGSFQRVIALPSPVESDGIEATFKDGVLHMHMPKASPEKHGVKRIQVKKA